MPQISKQRCQITILGISSLGRKCSGSWFSTIFWRFESKRKTFWYLASFNSSRWNMQMGPLCDRIVFHFSFLKIFYCFAIHECPQGHCKVYKSGWGSFEGEGFVAILAKIWGEEITPRHPHFRQHCPWCQGQQPFRARLCPFIQILSRFYPKFYPDKIRIKSG